MPLLVSPGNTREAVLLLLHADLAPRTASISRQIARHSGRSFTAVDDLVEPVVVEQLRVEAARLTPGEVIELARAALVRTHDRPVTPA